MEIQNDLSWGYHLIKTRKFKRQTLCILAVSVNQSRMLKKVLDENSNFPSFSFLNNRKDEKRGGGKEQPKFGISVYIVGVHILFENKP